MVRASSTCPASPICSPGGALQLATAQMSRQHPQSPTAGACVHHHHIMPPPRPTRCACLDHHTTRRPALGVAKTASESASCSERGRLMPCHVCAVHRVYFPDWAGNLWCLDAVTGSIIWTRKISDLIYEVDPNPYPPVTDTGMLISRTSPAISGGYLVSGLAVPGCARLALEGTSTSHVH